MKICIPRELWNNIWTRLDLCHKECLKMKEDGDTKGYEITVAYSDDESRYLSMRIIKGIEWSHQVGWSYPHIKVSLVLVGEGDECIKELRRIYSLGSSRSVFDRCCSLTERAPWGAYKDTAELELAYTSFTYGNFHFDHGGEFNDNPEIYYYDGGAGLNKRTMERIFTIIDNEEDLLKYALEECIILHEPEIFDDPFECDDPYEWDL